MIRKHGFKDYEEAVREATVLLLGSEKNTELSTTEHRGKDEEGYYLPFSYIENNKTGATAYLYSFSKNHYSFTLLSPEESKPENRTLPYRDVRKESLPLLLAIGTPIFKPSKEISPDEALTPDGIKALRSFIGDDGEQPFISLKEIRESSLKDSFEIFEDEDGETELGALLLRPYPQELTAKTGIAISTPSDYTKALEKAMGFKMSEEQREKASETFLFYSAETLLRYATYEFFRTESYARLQEVLSYYPLFALHKEWENEFTLLYFYNSKMGRKYSAETIVLGYYLYSRAITISSSRRLKEIAEYTGAPLDLMAMASLLEYVEL